MSGLSAAGFVAKRTPELKLELENLLLATFGPVNLNPAGVFGQLVGLTVEQQSEFWARLEEIYWSQYPDSATGVNLDRAVSINGLVRLDARPTSVLGFVTGTLGAEIPVASLARSASAGRDFQSVEALTLNTTESVGARIVVSALADNTDYTINLGGNVYTYNSGLAASEGSILNNLEAEMPPGVRTSIVTGETDNYLDLEYDTAQSIVVSSNLATPRVSNYLTFEAIDDGPVSVSAGGISQILTPIAGWVAVGNRFPGSPGRLVETDAELRARRTRSLKLAGKGTIESIVSQMQQVPGVLDQKIYVNNTSATVDSVPPHSIHAVVDGGTNADVAKVLFTYVAAGIGYYGSTTEDVYSAIADDTFEVKFSRPTNTPFYAYVEIKKSANTPTSAIELIRSALSNYISQNVGIADPVLWSRLFTPINAVIGDGAYVIDLFINTHVISSSTYETTANLVPGSAERLVLPPENIQVLVVA